MRKKTWKAVYEMLLVLLFAAGAWAGSEPNAFDPSNAADWYRRAFTSCEAPGETIDLYASVFENRLLSPTAEQYLRRHQAILADFTRAAQADFCDWHYDPYGDIWLNRLDHHEVWQMGAPKACVRVCLALMHSAQSEKSPLEMLEHFEALFRFADHLDLRNAEPVNDLLRFSIRAEIYRYLYDYINLHGVVLSADTCTAYTEFLEKQAPIRMDRILDERLEFARTALTRHTDQFFDTPTERILKQKGPDGITAFFESHRIFYERYIESLRANLENPSVLRTLTAQVMEQGIDECDLLYTRFGAYPQDFQPSQEDYRYLLKHSSALFASAHPCVLFEIYDYKVQIDAYRDGLLMMLRENK